MSEQTERRSEFTSAVRRGVGWGLGLTLVVGGASGLQRGGHTTLKAAMKGLLRAREAGSELAERAQDVYAEAQAEYTAERFGPENGTS